jgi:integrase
MATINYLLSTKTDATGKSEILIRFTHNGGKVNQRAKTNIFIQPEYWNNEKQQIIIPKFRLKNNEQKELENTLTNQNEKLSKIETTIISIFNDTDKKEVPKDWLKIMIDKLNFPEKYIPKVEIPETFTLLQFTDKFIKEAPNRKDKNTGRLLTPKNIQQYKACEKHLKEFAKSMKRKDFEFADIDQTFYDNFVTFLQEKQFTQNSVGKQIKVVKTMLNEATQQGLNSNTNYSNFHVFTEDIDTIYLNEDELQQLKGTDLSKIPHLDRVRDWFLLLAWTGSRFSDLEKITKSDIKDEFITFRQQKTNTKVVIPVHPIVVEVLEKYDYNLPEAITNQKFNEYIKTVCQIAEINSKETTTRTVGGKLITEQFEKWEHVSTHTGRRSFCTNMYKRGLPTLTIMKISGHKTEKSFLKYIKVTEQEHAEIMAKAWKEMYKGK